MHFGPVVKCLVKMDVFRALSRLLESDGIFYVLIPIKMLEIQEDITLVTQLGVQSLTCKLWLT